MSAICDAHEKVGVELLYKWVHRKFNQEKTSTQRGWAPSWAAHENGERNCYDHKSGGQYVAVLFCLQLPLTHNPFNKVRGIFF